ncbi:diacylglycerol/lipid kinase family protein [Marivirga sp.]|uniref:diacylglycerol/lipid kinase family protein n=1 Tax=Marivirga sp. TaxID=2018662 RepID=UPI003DA6D8DA
MMTTKKKIVFIANPISGFGTSARLNHIIDKNLSSDLFEYELYFTKRPGHAREIAAQAVLENIPIIVAVGGDGTINEVAYPLLGSSSTLGVIPRGSGNGLARHLGIPLNSAKAICTLNKAQEIKIDTCMLGDNFFINVAGIGFDGQVSKTFSQQKNRGFLIYAKCILTQFTNFKPILLEIKGKNISREGKYFVVAAANSSQYGNNAHIAPAASINDGFFDLVLMKPFPLISLPQILTKVFLGKLNTSRFVEIFPSKKVSIKLPQHFPVHLDGDYKPDLLNFDISINASSLRVLVPAQR